MTTDPKQPLRLTHGNTAKKRARGRRARRVFHGTLAAELNDRGAATVEELYLRFDCFSLPLEKGEIKQVLESARREGVVAEVSDERDGYGVEVSDQWTTTDKGKKLSRPRTLALPDLGYLLFGEHDRTVKAFDIGKTAVTMALPALALLGIHSLDPGTVTKWAAFGGAGVVIGWMLAYALRGELDLRAAAASWTRLKESRRSRWDYQMSRLRMGYLPAVVAVIYVCVGLWLGLGLFPWWVYAAGAAVIVAVYLTEIHPLYRAWHRTDPDLCRKEWKERGDTAAARVAQEAQAALEPLPSSRPPERVGR
jgi:hypothetical protein